MSFAFPFPGVFAAMVTPFRDGGIALCEQRLCAYCDFLISAGVAGLFVFGTTGEWPLLSEEERAAGARVVVRHVSGRLPVIIHAGATGTEQATRIAIAARDAGADAVSLICPAVYRLDDQALGDHFTTVAHAIPDLPVFLYNIPEATGNDISVDLFLQIARKADNVSGLKYSGDSLTRLRDYRRAMGNSLSIYNGNDRLALPALHEGADGLVSGNASARPELLAALYRLFMDGRHAEALQKQKDLDDFVAGRDPSCELSTFKGILALRGTDVGDVRSPLKRLSAEGRAALRRFLP
jgi:dihydrodipicolinate synthase/N-acetylneuraminate lyase